MIIGMTEKITSFGNEERVSLGSLILTGIVDCCSAGFKMKHMGAYVSVQNNYPPLPHLLKFISHTPFMTIVLPLFYLQHYLSFAFLPFS
jgi:hypothetical protein